MDAGGRENSSSVRVDKIIGLRGARYLLKRAEAISVEDRKLLEDLSEGTISTPDMLSSAIA